MKILQNTILAFIMGIGVVSLPAYANTPTDTSLTKLMTVMQIDKMMTEMLGDGSNMMPMLTESMIENDSLDSLTEYQREQTTKIIAKYTQMLVNQSSKELTNITRDSFVKAAKKYYTQEEVDAQIDFYASPIGQSIMNKQSKLMQDYMMDSMPKAMQTLENSMDAILPKMIEELEALEAESQ